VTPPHTLRTSACTYSIPMVFGFEILLKTESAHHEHARRLRDELGDGGDEPHAGRCCGGGGVARAKGCAVSRVVCRNYDYELAILKIWYRHPAWSSKSVMITSKVPMQRTSRSVTRELRSTPAPSDPGLRRPETLASRGTASQPRQSPWTVFGRRESRHGILRQESRHGFRQQQNSSTGCLLAVPGTPPARTLFILVLSPPTTLTPRRHPRPRPRRRNGARARGRAWGSRSSSRWGRKFAVVNKWHPDAMGYISIFCGARPVSSQAASMEVTGCAGTSMSPGGAQNLKTSATPPHTLRTSACTYSILIMVQTCHSALLLRVPSLLLLPLLVWHLRLLLRRRCSPHLQWSNVPAGPYKQVKVDAPDANLATIARAAVVRNSSKAARQGLTLVHFSAQLEPCLTQKHPTNLKHPIIPP